MTAAEPSGPAADLLGQVKLPVAGLYRRHGERNLSAVHAAILDSYADTGPVRLGPRRSLAVIAVDGLGYARAAQALRPAELLPLTSEFPTTTVACLLTSVTGQPADAHGCIGVQYLHADGRRTINCHDGRLTEPTGPGPVRPTRTPVLPTIFDTLAGGGVPTTVLPNELAALDAGVRGRLLHGAAVTGAPLPPIPDLPGRMAAFGQQVTATVTANLGGLTWAYLDLDSHVHRHGFDEEFQVGASELDRLARRLASLGAAVLIFSDHGLAPSRPSAGTLRAWNAATSSRWCRLPPGGAGRSRWAYPHPRHEDKLAERLADELPDAEVAGPGQLARWGLASAGSVGLRRLGEIVLLARGADFPVPDAVAGYEHGSMTADEVLIPMAIWPAA